MVSHQVVLNYAAKVSSISKGRSLNLRDANTVIRFSRTYCEIISGGLFAVCCLRVPTTLEQKVAFDLEFNNEILARLGSEWGEIENIEFRKSSNYSAVVSGPSFVHFPENTLWSGFRWKWDMSDACKFDSQSALAIFSSLPKMMHQEDESSRLASMHLAANGKTATAQATDGRMAVVISCDCEGSFLPALIPFAVFPLLRWAILEFGEFDQVSLSHCGQEVLFRVGPFHAYIKQVNIEFKPIDRLIDLYQKKTTSKAMLPLSELLSASIQIDQMKYSSCNVYFEPSGISFGAEENKDSKLTRRFAAECSDSYASMHDPKHLRSCANSFSRLGAQNVDWFFNPNDKGYPVLLSCKTEKATATAAIAQMVLGV